MDKKIAIELGEVQKTLLIPLFGRAVEFEKKNPLIRDRYSHEIVKMLDYDFRNGFKSIPVQFAINCAIRAYHLDTAVSGFIKRFPDATIVNIGAGLDTAFQRLDNGKIYWYDLDLPDTIALRRKLIPESARNSYIAKSVFDRSWFKDIKERSSQVFFISGGVLVYLDENEIKDLFLDLVQEFAGSEMVFDCYSKYLLRFRNSLLAKRKVKMELFSSMRWGVNSGSSITKWSNRIKIVDEFPFYSRINLKDYWEERILTPFKIMNFFKLMKMLHLKFN